MLQLVWQPRVGNMSLKRTLAEWIRHFCMLRTQKRVGKSKWNAVFLSFSKQVKRVLSHSWKSRFWLLTQCNNVTAIYKDIVFENYTKTLISSNIEPKRAFKSNWLFWYFWTIFWTFLEMSWNETFCPWISNTVSPKSKINWGPILEL